MHSSHPSSDEAQPFDLSRTSALFLLTCTSLMLLASFRTWFDASQMPSQGDFTSYITAVYGMVQMVRTGQADLFMDQVNLGAPLFFAMPPFPVGFTGALASITSCCTAPIVWFKWILIVLSALLPWSWYKGGRWMGFPRIASVAMGVLLFAIHSRYTVGLDISGILHRGDFAQLFAVLLFPLAVGSFHRRIYMHKGSLLEPVFWCTLVLLSHVFIGYFTCLTLLVLLLVGTEDYTYRWVQSVCIFGLTGLAIAFWYVPTYHQWSFIQSASWSQEAYNGIALSKWIQSVVQGFHFDQGRSYTWLGAVVVFGFLLQLTRWGKRVQSRWLILLLLISLVLFWGRTTWSEYYRYIPFHSTLNTQHYNFGLHFTGLLLAALAVFHAFDYMHQKLHSALGTSARYILLVLCLGTTALLLYGEYASIHRTVRGFDAANTDYQKVVSYLARHTKGRFLVDTSLGTGESVYRDVLAALSQRPQVHSEGIQGKWLEGSAYSRSFDFSQTAFQLYNVGMWVTLGTPQARHTLGIPSAKRVLRSGPYSVYTHTAFKPSYFEWVHLPLHISGSRKKLRSTLKQTVTKLFKHKMLPTFGRLLDHKKGTQYRFEMQQSGRLLMYKGNQEVSRSMTRAVFLQHIIRKEKKKIRAYVGGERHNLNQYEAAVSVEEKGAWLLLKVNYYPFWNAYIDKKQTSIVHVAPNFMAVHVPQGRHHVFFRYIIPIQYKLLFLLTCVLLGFALSRSLWKRLKQWKEKRNEEELEKIRSQLG